MALIRGKTLIKEFFVYGFSRGLGRFFGIFLIPIFTRTLDTAHFGALDLSMVMVIMFSLLFGLQLNLGMGRHYYEAQSRGTIKELISTSFWTWTVTSLLGSSLLLFFAGSLSRLFYGELYQEGETWIKLVSLTVFFQVGLSKTVQIFRYEHRVLTFSILSTLPFGLFFIMCIYLYLHKLNTTSILLAFLISNCITWVLALVLSRRYIGLNYNYQYLFDVIKYSLPLVPQVFFSWVQRHGLRLIITAYLGMELLGVFSVADKLAMIVAFITFAFRQAWIPQSFEIMNKAGSLEEYSKYLNIYLFLGTLLAIVLLLLNPLIVRILAPTEYYSAYRVSGMLVCGMIFISVNNFAGLGNIIIKRPYRNLAGVGTSVFISLFGSAIVYQFSNSLFWSGFFFMIGALTGNLIIYYVSSKVVYIDYDYKNIFFKYMYILVLALASTVNYYILLILIILMLIPLTKEGYQIKTRIMLTRDTIVDAIVLKV
jgi:O-antigen/teichoic acid export membrane protein